MCSKNFAFLHLSTTIAEGSYNLFQRALRLCLTPHPNPINAHNHFRLLARLPKNTLSKASIKKALLSKRQSVRRFRETARRGSVNAFNALA